jgi:hypothetical protein
MNTLDAEVLCLVAAVMFSALACFGIFLLSMMEKRK